MQLSKSIEKLNNLTSFQGNKNKREIKDSVDTMSHCIDAADPNSPLDPDGTIADMGAYCYNQDNAIDNNSQELSDNYFINYSNPIYSGIYK